MSSNKWKEPRMSLRYCRRLVRSSVATHNHMHDVTPEVLLCSSKHVVHIWGKHCLGRNINQTLQVTEQIGFAMVLLARWDCDLTSLFLPVVNW